MKMRQPIFRPDQEICNYFRLADFQRMFGIINEAEHVFGGQYLAVVADLSSLRAPAYSEECEAGIPAGFLSKVVTYSKMLKARSPKPGTRKHAAIWGGGSKGVLFALFLQRAGVRLEIVIDINPAKQGKYLAGSGLRVFTPDEAIRMLEPGADIFVMNSNYLEEIRQSTHNKYNYLEIDDGII